jgi:hypothetical protein
MSGLEEVGLALGVASGERNDTLGDVEPRLRVVAEIPYLDPQEPQLRPSTRPAPEDAPASPGM